MMSTLRKHRTAVWIAMILLAAALLAVLAAAWLHGWAGTDVTITVDGEPLHIHGLDSASLPVTLGSLAVALLVCMIVLPLGLLLALAVVLVVLVALSFGVLLPLAVVLLPVFALLCVPLLLAWMLLRWLWRRGAARPSSPGGSGNTIDA
jgi:hypothetical protein